MMKEKHLSKDYLVLYCKTGHFQVKTHFWTSLFARTKKIGEHEALCLF